MKSTGLAYDPLFLKHLTGPMHPERPERLQGLIDLFEGPRFADLPRIAARAASAEELQVVHGRRLIDSVVASSGRPVTQFDADTSASARSFDAARTAVGASLALADAVVDRSVHNGFAALRPPGHHAESNRVMGFCLFNNVAVVARYLQRRHGLERILIVDFDVHHGNGTQEIFWRDPSVLYASLHQYPFYPGTGGPTEIGEGDGAGFTVNAPMPAGCEEEDYIASMERLILPVARQFAPDFVLASAGYDAHLADPLASMQLQTASFGRITDALMLLAEECCEGRLMMLLEGGYDLTALRESVDTTLERMALPAEPVAALHDVSSGVAEACRALASHWAGI